MKHSYYMTCQGTSYWGVALMMYGKAAVQISETLHTMRPKLKHRWAIRRFRLVPNSAHKKAPSQVATGP